MGLFSRGDGGVSARVDAAIDAQTSPGTAQMMADDARTTAYVKRRGLEGVVDKMVDDAMDRYREGFTL